MKRLIPLLAVLLLLAPAALAGGGNNADNTQYAVVYNPDPTDRLNLRTLPDTGSISLGKFYTGTPVSVKRIEGEWAYVTLYDDFSGYMHTDFLRFGTQADAVASAMPVVTVTAPTGKHIADSMMRGASVLATLHIGMQMEVMGVMEDWLFVRAGTIAGFTENNGTTPRVYFSAPDATPAARVPLRPTFSPTPVPAVEYELVSAPVEGARNVTQDDWVIFAALKKTTPLFADRALTKPIDVLHYGQLIRVFNSANQYATVVADDHIAGYIPIQSYTVHSTYWPFFIDQPSAMVANPLVSDRLHLRQQPSQSARSLGRYYNGTVVTLLDNFSGSSKWTHVDICGVQGYMMSEYLDFSPDPGEHHPCLLLFEVHNPYAGTLPLRTQPDTLADSLGLFENGTLVSIIGFSGQWAHVICEGKTGFMMHQFLRTSLGTSFDPQE